MEDYENDIKKEFNELKKKLSEENRNIGFLENMLLDLSQSKYDKFYNLMLIIIGISSPIIPITFLFRRDLLNENNIIYILIITIIINIIIFIFCIIFIRVDRSYGQKLKYNIIDLKTTKLEVSNYKLHKLITKLEYRKNLSIYSGKFKFINMIFIKFNNIYIKLIKKYVKIKINKIEKSTKKIRIMMKKYIYGIEKKDDSLDFKDAIVLNTVAGAEVILMKVISYLDVNYINFKYVIILTITMYLFIAIKAIIKSVLKVIIKIITLLYRLIYKDNLKKIQAVKETNIELYK